MRKLTTKGNYPNAAPKDQNYGSIIVVSSVASTYGGCVRIFRSHLAPFDWNMNLKTPLHDFLLSLGVSRIDRRPYIGSADFECIPSGVLATP